MVSRVFVKRYGYISGVGVLYRMRCFPIQAKEESQYDSRELRATIKVDNERLVRAIGFKDVVERSLRSNVVFLLEDKERSALLRGERQFTTFGLLARFQLKA